MHICINPANLPYLCFLVEFDWVCEFEELWQFLSLYSNSKTVIVASTLQRSAVGSVALPTVTSRSASYQGASSLHSV